MQPLPSFMIKKFYDTQMYQKFAFLELYMSTNAAMARDKFWGETIILNKIHREPATKIIKVQKSKI